MTITSAPHFKMTLPNETLLSKALLMGSNCSEKLRADEFDVALVEIKIPKMNGIEVVRQADKEGINTDMIILTGHGDRADAVAAIKAHVFDWFDKYSLNLPELLASVFARTKALAEGVPPEEIRRLVSIMPG